VVTSHWVWANVCDTGRLIKVDPSTNRIAQRIDIAATLGSAAGVATASRDGLWVVSTSEGCDGGESCVLARLDPDTGKVLRKYVIDPQRGSGFLALDGATLWMGGPGVVTGFDAKSLKVTATYQATTYAEVEVGVGFGSLWATSYDLSEILRFDLPAS
jgi:hypothetical protein